MQQPINKLEREHVETFVQMTQPFRTDGTNLFDMYQMLATRSAIYPGQGTPLGLAYVALKMNGEAGEFAEHVGKAMRDDGYFNVDTGPDGYVRIYDADRLTPERRDLLIKEIGDVLWYLSAACNELGINLADAASVNLIKLLDRTERDALRGSGDER